MSHHIELGNDLWLDIYESANGVSATLTQMPHRVVNDELLFTDERIGEDHMIMRWDITVNAFDRTKGEVADIENMAAKALRAMAKLIDGLPIVTGIEVRNDPMAWDRARHSATGFMLPGLEGVELELLKVMVTLEDDPRQRIVQETVVSPMEQNINHGSNAYSFGTRMIDPVAERWRQEETHVPNSPYGAPCTLCGRRRPSPDCVVCQQGVG